MNYKDDPVAYLENKRLKRIQEAQQNALINVDEGNEPESDEILKDSFNQEVFLKKHPNGSCETFTNFNDDELQTLTEIIETNLPKKRGKKSQIDIKSSLFLALMYCSSYITYEEFSAIVSVKISTLQRVVKRVTVHYFPILINKFIPKSVPSTRRQFINFPDAVGAVDSTTIPFYCPTDKEEKKASWDAKNHCNGLKVQCLVNADGICIHCFAQYHAGTHDKKIFDLSGVTQFVTVKRTKI